MVRLNPGEPTAHASGQGYTNSVRWSPSGTASLLYVWWHSRPAGSSKPTKVTIYNVTAGSTVVSWSPASGDWVSQPNNWFRLPVPLNAGNAYTVPYNNLISTALYLGASNSYLGYRTDGPGTPGAGLSFEGCCNALGDVANPTGSISAGQVWSIDMEVSVAGVEEPEPPPFEEPDPGSIDPGGTFPYWMHYATVNPDSAIKRLYDWWEADRVLLANAKTKVDQIDAYLTERFGVAGSALGGVLKTYLDILQGTMDQVDAAIGNVRTVDLPAISDKIDALPTTDVAPTIDTFIGRDAVPIPGSGWTLVDTLIGSGAGVWDQPADRYVFTITNPEILSPSMVIGGIPYFTHRGWWAPCNIDLVGNHQTFVGNKSEWYEVGQRLPGAIWHVDPFIEWTLQAFDYAPEP